VVAALVLIGACIVGVAFFTTQAQQTQSLVRAAYQEEGASAFVVEVSGISDEELDRIVAGRSAATRRRFSRCSV
jgi:hypothetical protein